MHDIDGPNISLSEIGNIGPGEGQIPVSCLLQNLIGKHLHFLKTSTGRNDFDEECVIPITPSKYVHLRLKCCDDRFALILNTYFMH